MTSAIPVHSFQPKFVLKPRQYAESKESVWTDEARPCYPQCVVLYQLDVDTQHKAIVCKARVSWRIRYAEINDSSILNGDDRMLVKATLVDL